MAFLARVGLTLAIGRYALDRQLPDRPRSVSSAAAAWREHWPSLLPMPHPSPRNQRWLRSNARLGLEAVPVLSEGVRELV